MRGPVLLAAVAGVACGGSSAGELPDSGAAVCTGDAQSAADVVGCIPDGPWLLQLSAAADRPISGDIVAATEITLRSGQIAVPDPCPDCLDHVRFRSTVDAITLDDDAGDDYLVQARRARIPAGTRFRVRVHSISEFPFFPVVLPTLSFVPASDAACAADEERCAVDDVCYRLSQVCYHCDRLGGATCACVDDQNQPRPGGSACEYAISFDQLASGTCVDGTCVTD